MEIKGTVTTGLGKAQYFLSQDFYIENFIKFCGFKPYPGTLNIIVPDCYLDELNDIKDNCNNIIKPENNFGAVKFIKAKLNNEINVAIVFPAKTSHDQNYIEIIANEKLRDKLNLIDEDEVYLIF